MPLRLVSFGGSEPLALTVHGVRAFGPVEVARMHEGVGHPRHLSAGR